MRSGWPVSGPPPRAIAIIPDFGRMAPPAVFSHDFPAQAQVLGFGRKAGKMREITSIEESFVFQRYKIEQKEIFEGFPFI